MTGPAGQNLALLCLTHVRRKSAIQGGKAASGIREAVYTWQGVNHVDEAGGGGGLTHRQSCWMKLGLGLAAERLEAHAAGRMSQGLSPLSPARSMIIISSIINNIIVTCPHGNP